MATNEPEREPNLLLASGGKEAGVVSSEESCSAAALREDAEPPPDNRYAPPRKMLYAPPLKRGAGGSKLRFRTFSEVGENDVGENDADGEKDDEEMEEAPFSKVADRQLRLLLERQAEKMPLCLDELRVNGRKRRHWSWWAWPTELEGSSEPYPKTAVSFQTAPLLLELAPEAWRAVLEAVVTLVAENQGVLTAVIPKIDHGRIKFFVSFWRKVPQTPAWLHKVLDSYETALKQLATSNYAWPPQRTTGFFSSNNNNNNNPPPREQRLQQQKLVFARPTQQQKNTLDDDDDQPRGKRWDTWDTS